MRAFKLTRYFSLLSLILLLLAGALLGKLVRQHEITQMERVAEDRNVNMTQMLGNLLRLDMDQLISRSLGQTRAELQAHPDIRPLHDKLARLIQGSDIAKVKIYSLTGVTVFSTEAAQIGEDKSSNAGFLAARNGQIASELVHRNHFSATERVLEDVDLLSSYVPVLDGGRVVAVFEQYQDVTKLMHHIEQSLWQMGMIICAVLGALYLMLLAVVRHAQTALTAQEAMLEAANRDLDQRVEERTHALRQSEARLRESEARFRSLTEMSSDFYWESDTDHRFTSRTLSAREAADPVFCQTPFVGVLRWQVPHTTPDEAAWQVHRALLEAHLPFRDFEMSHQGAENKLLYVSVSGDPVLDAAGTFTGYRGVGADITARKQAEIELSIAATAFDSQQSMLVTDANNVIQRVNTAFIESSGYSLQEIVGQSPRILQSGQHDRAFYTAMWDSITQHGYWHGELWSKRKNGEVFPKWLSISAVKDRHGGVTHYIGAYIDISERKLAEEKIRKLAFFDQLTGLPNRTLLLERLQQTTAANARVGAYGALLFLDLDNFKELNDTRGHASGDVLLNLVAQRLSDKLRPGDTLARLGGDEFMVMMSSVEASILADAASEVELACQKLLNALAQPYVLLNADFHCSASIGITLFRGQETSVDDLLRQADLAMYQAKSRGGNTIVFFDPVMESSALAHACLENELRLAIGTGQLELYYQPQVSGSSGQILGAEALIRWNHPQRGLVPPNDFIAHAERTGLILPLGQWVLETACQHLAAWASQPDMAHLTVAVNVSAQQFKLPDFAEQVIATLARTGANPQQLKLELTESVFAGNIDEIVAMMVKLRALGVGFSLDDFGTGYSSLAYLSRLPLDQLKIDRSFVTNIESGDNNMVICAATISLAHSLRLKVVAEGVEDNAQQYFLSTVHRCDLLQGYLYSRPLPQQAFEKLVATWRVT